MRNCAWFLVALFGLCGGARAQVVINEFSAANYSLGFGGGNEDFLELYNTGPTAVNLAGYWLSDNPANPQKFEIPAGTNVAAGGRVTILCSGEGEVPGGLMDGGYLNTNFKVTQTAGEAIVFSSPTGALIESYTFGTDWTPNLADHSWARIPDGSGTWKVCTDPTPNAVNPGAAAASVFNGYAPVPAFSVPAGYSAGPVNVTLTAPAGFSIRYTTNGYEPTATSTLYGAPIAINATTVLRARCFDASGALATGLTETNTYLIGSDAHSILVVSVSGDNEEDGEWPGGWWGPAQEPAHVEFFYPDGSFWCEASGDANEHGNDSNAYPQKGFDYITRDQMGHSDAIEAELFHVKNRDAYQRLIFKAAANDNYPSSGGGHIRDAYVQTLSHLAQLHVDERTNESCIVYLNGQYWGVYEYREKVDDLDFTEEYYDQPRHFVDFIKTWGGTWVEYGSDADWQPLVNFITGSNMADPANYDYVTSVYNEMSLIDYVLLNSFVVCADWLNWNTAWWRGRHPDGDGRRWRYALWDMDNTFGHGANYTGIPSQQPDADPCNPESLGDPGGQGHIPIFNALLENETFWATYINRWADLSNTHFSCNRMHEVLDSMVAVIDPEMQRHIQRWGGNYGGWQANVQEIHDFIDDRCAATLIGGLEDCYEVEAVSVTVIIDGLGEVEINSVDIGPADSPLSATYFAGVPMQLTAEATLGMEFIGWEVVSGDVVLADPMNPVWGFELTGDVEIIAHFAPAMDPQPIVFRVEPAGAGSIAVDGGILASLPSTEFLVGSHTFAATPVDEWHVFTGWSTTGLGVTPSDVSPTVSCFVNQPDTITAHFAEIVHVDLVVRVEPPYAGSVRIEGGVVVVNEWEGGLEPIGPVDALATPAENFEFVRWEGAYSNPSPGPEFAEVAFPVEGSDTLTAYFRPVDFALYVPSAFSPNNDGLNDAFLPAGAAWGGAMYRFVVLNRWGEQVFSSTTPGEPWIGQHQGAGAQHFVPDGVYAFEVTAVDVHTGVPVTRSGWVQVVR